MFEHGYALLIGVDESKMPSLGLPIVKKDVTHLSSVIAHPDRCGYLQEHVKTLTGPDATRANILDGLAWLQQCLAADPDPNQTALIYYSGHGHRDPAGEAFLIPYDVRYPLRLSALSARDFAASIDAIKPRRLLAILDCCHAESLDVKDTTPTGLASAAVTADSPGVNVLATGDGRAVLSSSSDTQKSWIRTDGAMSVFTYHLVEALTGYTDRPDLPDVTVTEVMEYVARKVPSTARTQHGADQEPVFRFTGTAFPVALVIGGKGLEKGAKPPDPLGRLPIRIRGELKVERVGGEATNVDIEELGRGEVDANTDVTDVLPGGKLIGVKIGKVGL